MVFLESCRKDFCRKWLNLGSSLKHYIFYFTLWTTSLYNQPECLLGNYHSVKLQIICFKLSVWRCQVFPYNCEAFRLPITTPLPLCMKHHHLFPFLFLPLFLPHLTLHCHNVYWQQMVMLSSWKGHMAHMDWHVGGLNDIRFIFISGSPLCNLLLRSLFSLWSFCFSRR